MLTIRKEQMQTLGTYMRRAFEDRVATYLRQTFPEQVEKLGDAAGGDDALRSLIRQGIEKAGRHGLEVERDVARFVEFMVRVAPNFDELPEMRWAAAILRDRGISAHGRVELIHQQLESRSPSGGVDGQRKPA